MSLLTKNVPVISRNLEISLEANPETINRNFLSDSFSAGINRLSVGVQSLSDHLLVRLDRQSNHKVTLSALEQIADCSAKGLISNWNADIIYGIPGQKEKDLMNTMRKLIDFNPGHISAYALTLDQNTLPDKSNISLRRQMLHQKLVWDYLPSKDFEHYEVSNFAKKGFRCLHNLTVWKYRPYLSLGTGGHSFLNAKRYRTISNIDRYLAEPVENLVVIENAMVIPDLFITALRLKSRQGNSLYRRSLSLNEYSKWRNLLDIFQQKNWITYDSSGFIITAEGLNFSASMIEMAYELPPNML